MTDKRVKDWQEKSAAVQAAKAWQRLPNGPKYQNDSFAISIAHCKAPQLVRAGQQSCGGNNYWETGKELNQAILEFLVKNWNGIYPEVIKIMEDKEKAALLDLQSYVDSVQNLINIAKEN